MKNHTKFTALITTTLLTVALAGPANATGPEVAEPTVETVSLPVLAPKPIKAESNVSLAYERPAVTTTRYEAPVPAAPLAVTSAPVASKATAPVTIAAHATVAPVASASGKGQAILSAAYAQLGVVQDCTALVSNSLSAVGIHFHDWPAGYLSLGAVVPASQAQPGDLIYYADGGAGSAHIAVYAGNGQAVHGGYNGNQTVVFSANVGSGPVFIRVA